MSIVDAAELDAEDVVVPISISISIEEVDDAAMDIAVAVAEETADAVVEMSMLVAVATSEEVLGAPISMPDMLSIMSTVLIDEREQRGCRQKIRGRED